MRPLLLLPFVLLACSGPDSFELVGALRVDPPTDTVVDAGSADAAPRGPDAPQATPHAEDRPPTPSDAPRALVDAGSPATDALADAPPATTDGDAIEDAGALPPRDVPADATARPDDAPTVDAGEDPAAQCAQATTCGACVATTLARFGCGWCATSARCLYGTEAGALRGSCAGGWTTTCR